MRRVIRVGVTMLLATTVFATVMAAQPAQAAFVGKWFWQNPIPQGGLLNAADLAGDVGWTVGSSGVMRSTNGGGSWAPLYGAPVPLGVWCTSVDAVDNLTAWVTRGDGVLMHTHDAGETWAEQSLSTADPLTAVAFRSASEGFVASALGTLWHTADGGETWAVVAKSLWHPSRIVEHEGALFMTAEKTLYRIAPGSTTPVAVLSAIDPMRDISFGDSQHGIVVSGLMGQVWYTTNGGLSWSRSPVTLGMADLAVHHIGPQTAYLFVRLSCVYKTTNNGASWVRVYPRFYDRTGAAVKPWDGGAGDIIRAPGRLILFGGGGLIYYSVDSGASWRQVTGDFFDYIYDIEFVSPRAGIAICGSHDRQLAYLTADGGATWSPRPLPGGIRPTALSIAPNGRGWMVGQSTEQPYAGRVYRTYDGGRTFVFQKTPTPPWQFDGVCTLDGNTALLTGQGGVLMRTTDGGVNWKRVYPDLTGLTWGGESCWLGRPVMGETGLCFIQAGNGIIQSSDWGATWKKAPFGGGAIGLRTVGVRGDTVVWENDGDLSVGNYPTYEWTTSHVRDNRKGFSEIRFLSDSVVIAVGESGVYQSNDAGRNWTWASGVTGVNHVAVAGGTEAWVAGGGGSVLYNGGVNGDYVPPVTRTAAPAGWSEVPVYVTLDALDQTGIAGTWWAYGAPSTTVAAANADVPGAGIASVSAASVPSLYFRPYKGRIRVSAEGVTPVTFYSRDANGNFESPRTVRVRIDRRPPIVSSNARRTYGGVARVKVSARDLGVGVKKLKYTVDGGSVRTVYGSSVTITKRLGRHTLTYWATDRRGHTSAKVTRKFRVRPVARLTQPWTPNSVTTSAAFLVKGNIEPSHASAAPVVIRTHRLVNGAWIAGPSVTASAKRSGDRNSYRTTLRLPYPGKWRIVATHADSEHYRSVSPARYLESVLLQ